MALADMSVERVRRWAPLAVVLILGASAVPALGRPRLSAASDFLAGNLPTRDGALAAVELVFWTLVIAILVAQLAHALHWVRERELQVRQRRLRSRATLLLGLLIFAGGLLHHQPQVGSLCCGDINAANELLR